MLVIENRSEQKGTKRKTVNFAESWDEVDRLQ
jgi:hypothetical protein